MKLALIGYPIKHSKSPELYRRLFGAKLIAYDLLEVSPGAQLPPLRDLARTYQGLNITTPFKQSYLNEVEVQDPVARTLSAVNTIDLRSEPFQATNTDAVAVRSILTSYRERYGHLHLLILGDGVMGRLLQLVARELETTFQVFNRRGGNLPEAILPEPVTGCQTIVVNCCSRDFVFHGRLHPEFIFWDLNYEFPAHGHIASMVKSYSDGLEMLELQAKAAADFWTKTYS